MLISHRKKFIFVHIYKTAGTSITSMLLPYASLRSKIVFKYFFTRKFISMIINIMRWHDHGHKQFIGVHKHAPAIDIKNFYGEKLYNSYYSFVVVRNPYDLVVSLYFYLRQSTVHVDHKRVLEMDFNAFVDWYIYSKPPLQIHFLTDPNTEKRIVSYVARFETLSSDIKHLKTTLKLDGLKGLEHQNPSKKRSSKDYRDYYDANTKEKVGDYFRKDIELLGYAFEEKTLPSVPIMQQ